MRNIIVCAGHSDGKGASKDRGASGQGYVEGDLTIELRDLVISELAKLGIVAKTDSNRNALKETLAWLIGKFTSKDILLDLHFNAGGGTGVEVIIPESYSKFEINLAQSLADSISKVTGWKKRAGGVKKESDTARKRLGWMRPNAQNILLETCFIDSKADMLVYQASKNIIAKSIANTLLFYSKL
jgi:N-acetylmuramoyl-L-alanine amidase